MRSVSGTSCVLVAALALGWLAGTLGVVSGCGSSHSQASARDEATSTRCNWEQSCGNIGAGKTYVSMDNCLVQVRATVDSIWPAAECDGKINEAQLKLCLDAISLVECNNALAAATSLAVNCNRGSVCKGP